MAQKFPKDIQKLVDQYQAARKLAESSIKAAPRDSAAAKDLQSRLKEQDARFDKETKGTPVARNLQDMIKRVEEALKSAQDRFTVEIDQAARNERRNQIFSMLCTVVRALEKLRGNSVLQQRMSAEVDVVKAAYERACKERDDNRAWDMFDAMERPLKALQGRLADAAKVADVVGGAIEATFKRVEKAIEAILAGGGVRRVFKAEVDAAREALNKATTQLNPAAAKSAVADRLGSLERQAWRVQDVWSRSREMLIEIDRQLKAACSPKDLQGWMVALHKARMNWYQYKTAKDMAMGVEAFWQDLNELAKAVQQEAAHAK